jgi:RND family efflux transporter MFP subunit
MMSRPSTILSMVVLAVAGCTRAESTPAPLSLGVSSLETVTAVDTVIAATVEAAGIAAPIEQATLSTRLMGTVTDVLVREGEFVRRGQVLVRLDTRDLTAKDDQARAGLAAAVSRADEAERYAVRIRALYADSAAPKALLDGAEAGVAQAQAGLAQARGAQRELAAVAGYGAVRAPFDGVVTRRFVDPGAFAAPGTPLVTVQDGRTLRISVTTTPDLARGITRGRMIETRIESAPAAAMVEGVVPAPGGALYTINALVSDRDGRYASGGAAVLLVPRGLRHAVFVPQATIARQGDLTGVRVLEAGTPTLRWVRLGAVRGDQVEVLSGLQGGERLVVTRVSEGS